MIRFATAALISAVALTSAFGASAQSREAAQVHVSAAHVDFSNARQTRAFYAKLTAAADRVCTSEVSDPMTQMADAQCARDAVSNAVAEINAPALSALDQSADRAPSYAMADRRN